MLATADEPFRVVLEPRHRSTLSSDVTTTVATINKHMGESFKKGDILMTLDDAVFKANYEKGLAVLERGKAELHAQQELYNDKAAALLDLREAQAKVAVGQAELALAEKEYKACTLTAPYLGKVQEVRVQEFEHVEPGKPLMDILDDNILVAKLLLPPEVGLKLTIGKTLNITIPDAGGTFPAVITRIAPGIDPVSSLVKIDSEINNEKGLLRAGMIGELQFHSNGTK